MTITERELFSQYQAMERTYDHVLSVADDLNAYLSTASYDRIIFIGCGSSYCLAKSAAAAANLYLKTPAFAHPAGDLLLSFPRYHPLLEGALLVSISRSGSTTEVVELCKKAADEMNCPILSLCAKVDSVLSRIAGFNLEIPWAFDESVCQTRCVTNLYLAVMLMIGIVAQNQAMIQSLKSVVENGPAFIQTQRNLLEQIAAGVWKKITVLADGELAGIAEEGALAFTEIALLPSHYYHLLDVRHGPMVLIDSDTLVIAALVPGEAAHQNKLLADIKKQGAQLVVYSDARADVQAADHHITVPPQGAYAAQGIPFIFLAQAISLFRALKDGINPDQPAGLDPWIKL